MIAVGVGASRGCPPSELAELVDAGLRTAGLTATDVGMLASADVKADEPALLALAAVRGWALQTFPAAALAAVTVPTPSATVARHVGTPSVAEASALLAAAPAELLLVKQRSAHATCAIARSRLPTASRDDSTATIAVQSSLDAGDGGAGVGVGAGAGAGAAPPTAHRVYAATDDCKGCGACLKTCPERALRPSPAWFDGPPLLTLIDRCTGCGECLEICPADAFVALAPEEAPWPA